MSDGIDTSSSTDAPGTDDAPSESSRFGRERGSAPLAVRLSRIALPVILVGFIVFFSFARPDRFFTVDNFKTILATQSVLAILAIATIIPLIIGEFDLSVGANLGLAAIVVTGVASEQGQSFTVSVIAALGASTAVGLINGVLVAKVGVNAFISTLAMSTIIAGSVLWYTGGNVFYENIPSTLLTLGQGEIGGIPIPVLFLAGVSIVIWYMLEHVPVGRYLHALGGSKEAARLSGLHVVALTLFAFTLTGFLAGIAGVLQSATLGSGNPTVGPQFLLPAFAAAFLGATAITPGTYNVVGTVVAVFTLQTGIIGLQLMGVPFFVEPIFTGVALILAVAVTRFLRREAL